MAWFLSAVFSCDEETGKLMAELLARDTRPEFPEDIPVGWKKFYDCLENLDYPKSIVVRKKRLYVEWNDDDTQLKDLARLAKCSPNNSHLKVVYYVPDDPMSGDEEDDEDLAGYVLAMRGDRLEKVSEQDIKKCLAGRKSTCISERNAQRQLFFLADLL